MKSIYLDYAAATPLDGSVLAAMQPYLTDKFYNPSAVYLAGKAVSSDLQAARARVARQLGGQPSEVIFTAGGTEANNLAINGVMAQFPSARLLVSAIEHDAVLKPAGAYDSTLIPVRPDGLVDLAALEKLIDDRTVLVSVMYANNEIGTIQPMAEIAALVAVQRRARRAAGNDLPLYLHTDACQAGNLLSLQVGRLGVDLMTLNGGKIYGPKQSGVLFADSHVRLKPQILGGGQELGRRSGTENVAGAIGFAEALDIAQGRRADEAQRLAELQKLFFDLVAEKIPAAIANGSRRQRLANNIHLTFPDTDNERLMMELDERGIQCAVGSACSASTDEPSHVLAALGLPISDIQSSLRFTLGRQTTESDIRKTVDSLAGLTRTPS